jgi:hypothetical protein
LALLSWAKGINNYSNWQMGEYIGLSLTLLAFAGIIKAIKYTVRLKTPLFIGIITSAIFVFGLSVPRLNWFYELTGMMPKRFILFLLMFLCIFSAIGYRWLQKYFERPYIALIAITLVILIDLMPTIFQYNWLTENKIVLQQRDVLYKNISPGNVSADLANTDSSMFEYGRGFKFAAIQTLYFHAPSPYGYYPQFAPKSTCYSYPWLNIFAIPRGFADSSKLLPIHDKIAELLNLKYIIYQNPSSVPGLAENENVTSIIISGSITPWLKDSLCLNGPYCYSTDYLELLDSTKIDSYMAIAENLWIRRDQRIVIENFVPARPIVSQFDLHQNTAQITVETKSDCFARIPLSYYPDIKIYINGNRSREIYESADHFMIVRLAKGVSKIDVVPCRSKIEIASLLLSGLCLIAVNVALYRERKIRKTKSP